MTHLTNRPTAQARAGTAASVPRPGAWGGDVLASLIGLWLLLTWLALFTIGSQIDSSPYQGLETPQAFGMFILTNRETSVTALAILASCLGTWRHRNVSPDDRTAATRPGVAYTAGAIGGLFFGLVTVVAPWMLTGVFSGLTLARDQMNYATFAVIGSFIAFVSGCDPNVFDRWINRWAGGRPAG